MDSLHNWIPFKLENQTGAWQLHWMDLGEMHITAPFFDETIGICSVKMRERSPYKSVSNIDFLLAASTQINTIAPTAFIFHVSRCGSTLLSQALSTDSRNIVFAEAPLLDEILRASVHDDNLTEEEIEKWFKAALNVMGQKRKPAYQQLFVKLDSWHIHFYPLLRKWFPDTPFYFLTRKPDAIIASHHKRRGLHSIPGLIEADLLKVKLGDEHYRDFNFFTAQVLEGYYKALYDLVVANYLLDHFYDYSWGMKNLFTHFFASIGKELVNENEMQQRLNNHSKYPDQPFSGDAKVKLPNYEEANSAYENLITQLTITGPFDC